MHRPGCWGYSGGTVARMSPKVWEARGWARWPPRSSSDTRCACSFMPWMPSCWSVPSGGAKNVWQKCSSGLVPQAPFATATAVPHANRMTAVLFHPEDIISGLAAYRGVGTARKRCGNVLRAAGCNFFLSSRDGTGKRSGLCSAEWERGGKARRD